MIMGLYVRTTSMGSPPQVWTGVGRENEPKTPSQEYYGS